jgi:ribosome-binding factor A
MTAPRKTRLGETIRAELADILRTEMRDPRFTANLLSITDVDVTADLKIATVYISVLGDENARQEALKALRGAAGLLRVELGRTKVFKNVPELHFRYDESIERGAHVFELIQHARKEDEALRAASSTEEDTSEE